MKMKRLIAFLFIVNGAIHCWEKEFYVNRIYDEGTYETFPETIDHFANPWKDSAFCMTRNGNCANATCEECMCRAKDTFISYQHGCMDKQNSDALLKASTCFKYRDDYNSIPAASPNSFLLTSCVVFQYPSNIDQSKLCTIDSVSTISLLDGSELLDGAKPLLTFEEDIQGTMCLQCIDEASCELPLGNIFKYNLTCPGENGSTFSTCFLLKTTGMQKTTVNISKPTTTRKTTTTVHSSATNIRNATMSTESSMTSKSPIPSTSSVHTSTTASNHKTSTTRPSTMTPGRRETNRSIGSNGSAGKSSSLKDKPVVIAGIVVALVVVSVIIGAIVYWQMKRKMILQGSTQVTFSKNDAFDNDTSNEDISFDTTIHGGSFKASSLPG